MEIPLQITFRHMGPSEAVETAIRKRAERLERFFDRIIACRVVVEAPHKHQRKGKLYSVRVGLSMPGEEIPITRNGPKDHSHEDIYVAIRDAFDTLGRVLEDRARRMRGEVKTHETPLHGTVVRLFPYEGYGFVETSDRREIYFHKNSVVGRGFEKLEVGADVSLVLAENESEHGPQASTVTPLGKHHIVD